MNENIQKNSEKLKMPYNLLIKPGFQIFKMYNSMDEDGGF